MAAEPLLRALTSLEPGTAQLFTEFTERIDFVATLRDWLRDLSGEADFNLFDTAPSGGTSVH